MKVAGLGTEQRDVRPAPGQECSLLSPALCFTRLALLWAQCGLQSSCAHRCAALLTPRPFPVSPFPISERSVSLHLSPELPVSLPIPFFCLIKKKFFLIFKFLKFNLQPSARLILHIFSHSFLGNKWICKEMDRRGKS